MLTQLNENTAILLKDLQRSICTSLMASLQRPSSLGLVLCLVVLVQGNSITAMFESAHFPAHRKLNCSLINTYGQRTSHSP
jgi:hypothetical protein